MSCTFDCQCRRRRRCRLSHIEILKFFFTCNTRRGKVTPCRTPPTSIRDMRRQLIDNIHTYYKKEKMAKEVIGREAALLGEIGTKMIRLDGVNHVHEVPVESMDLGLQLAV